MKERTRGLRLAIFLVLVTATSVAFIVLAVRISREAPDWRYFGGIATMIFWSFLAGMMFVTLWVRPTED